MSDKNYNGGNVRNGLCIFFVVSLKGMESPMELKNASLLLQITMPRHSMVSLVYSIKSLLLKNIIYVYLVHLFSRIILDSFLHQFNSFYLFYLHKL